ncbi:hypothetical protein K0B96_10185 [Horticoccus luteus]|uniref:Pectate lyase-like protein n=1 Tax=Horticoccus luteus TaxID=2862869 RepID=A0A8F9XIK8_9BACT|nr:hypothetical protein [Horticoccus luteus]QYM77693.1 hypothetical protein K0B96_10185 [Horticoccus luteus]
MRFSILILATLGLMAAPMSAGEKNGDAVLNVRDFGAVGDGQVHLVREWVEAGRYRNLDALRRDYSAVDSLDWSVDEAAFERAKSRLPLIGGTIYFPAGHYVAARQAWTIKRDRVTLRGDGADKTILSTVPKVPDGLVLAGYRHVGWLESAEQAYPFSAESGARGSDVVRLNLAEWAREFEPGELVFIRNGAAKFDQDYGEFNEVAAVGAAGELQFKYPFARDYTLPQVNWAGETADAFTMPKVNEAVEVKIRRGEGFHQPSHYTSITIGEEIFRVLKAKEGWLTLRNPGRGNSPAGTVVPAGARIAKSRAVIRLTQSTRDFAAEGLQIVGRRKVLNLSNSYRMRFTDCVFVRDASAGDHRGGVTIDGDDGRFAVFERCTVRATPAATMQFARSFGGVTFRDCHFVDASVVFTEFNFDCAVEQCAFDVESRGLDHVIVVGNSGGDLRVLNNRIVLHAPVKAVFDAITDIHSQRHGGEGPTIIRGNQIESAAKVRIFGLGFSSETEIEGNTRNGKAVTRKQ